MTLNKDQDILQVINAWGKFGEKNYPYVTGSFGHISVRAVYVCDTMKWLALTGMLLITPAYADTVCPENKICPTCKPICYEATKLCSNQIHVTNGVITSRRLLGDRPALTLQKNCRRNHNLVTAKLLCGMHRLG